MLSVVAAAVAPRGTSMTRTGAAPLATARRALRPCARPVSAVVCVVLVASRNQFYTRRVRRHNRGHTTCGVDPVKQFESHVRSRRLTLAALVVGGG